MWLGLWQATVALCGNIPLLGKFFGRRATCSTRWTTLVKLQLFLVFVIFQELATKNNCHSCRSGDRGDLRPAGGHGGGHHRHWEDTLARQPWPGGRQSSCWCSFCSTWWWKRKSWSHSLHCLFMMVILMILIMWKIRLLSHCRSCKALSLKLEKSLLVTKAISPSISRWNRNTSLTQGAQYFVKFPDPIQSSLTCEGQWAQDWLSVEGSAASEELRDILGELEQVLITNHKNWNRSCLEHRSCQFYGQCKSYKTFMMYGKYFTIFCTISRCDNLGTTKYQSCSQI